MIATILDQLIKRQLPYYLIDGTPIKGIDNQYWLVFKHRDGDKSQESVITLLSSDQNQDTYKLLRIDLLSAEVTEYIPEQPQDIPSVTLLRTTKLETIERFLIKRTTETEPLLLAGTFLEIQPRRRRFSLPNDREKYNYFITESLKRCQIYRRSTAYFDSGILKVYEEPLQHIIQSEGKIYLLMDWQGFTKEKDLEILSRLEAQEDPYDEAQRSLEEFLQGLEEKQLNSTEILAELVRLDFLRIKLIKMESGRGIYHKKTGILSDVNGNHILHEGSDNFTYAAYARNVESVTFLYSWDRLDGEEIEASIQQFEEEWNKEDVAFDISQEFLQQVIKEKKRRHQLTQPHIDSITPDRLTAGETTAVEIKGSNLDQVVSVSIPDDQLVNIDIQEKEPNYIKADVFVDRYHPGRSLGKWRLKTTKGVYDTEASTTPQVSQELTIPEFEEIAGFKEAVTTILEGKHGKPEDFLYWLAKQRPQQFKVATSNELDRFLEEDVLFEHQKSGALHCHRVMRDFGLSVCADAVGLGKTRLAAAVASLYRQSNRNARVAIVAAKKLHSNWVREMAEIGFEDGDYELYNKNLMSRKNSNFLTDFTRYGGADLVIIDEAHEGIRNYGSRVHKTCLEIKEKDLATHKKRHFLLLTATPWNNRREDIYNILFPFISRPSGFTELGLPPQVSLWFANRETGKELFTDETRLFRRVYRELFLQRTRKMLLEATPDLTVYPKRQAQWLPVEFEPATEKALEEIFTQFEDSLYIPFADPLRYLSENVEQRSLLANQRRFFLQRAESSMYALSQTLSNFAFKVKQLQRVLNQVTPDAEGLREFLLIHYGLKKNKPTTTNLDIDDSLLWDEETEEDEVETEEAEKRAKTKRSIFTYTDALSNNPERAKGIIRQILNDCQSDLSLLAKIQKLLAIEFVVDHKRETVTQQVKELVNEGKKVLLISTFSDTVIDYYLYMAKEATIASKGIGMAIGAEKIYYQKGISLSIQPHNLSKKGYQETGLKREELFKRFAPVASCKDAQSRPTPEKQIQVLIGSETLSVGQNLQDADYLINIDLPWNPMILEQRIGRIDRPKQHKVDSITIYYANSESQLLRQASRLDNLHKKLVGDLVTKQGEIPTVNNAESLGASIYGDTLFDDEILPGYIDFLTSLVKARKMTQNNLQEEIYCQQETQTQVYTHTEILHSEEISRLLSRLGKDYQPNPIALGRGGSNDEPLCLVVLAVEYFDINGKEIPEQKSLIFWNDKTQEKDAYGVAIATGFKTPEAGGIFSSFYLLEAAKKVYESLVEIKRQLEKRLQQTDKLENMPITSARLSKIQTKIFALETLPQDVDKAVIKTTLKKLSSNKESKTTQKILRDFSEGEKLNLCVEEYLSQLIAETDRLNLIDYEKTKPQSLKISLMGMLLRA